jgi:aromatic ring hydroxylase
MINKFQILPRRRYRYAPMQKTEIQTNKTIARGKQQISTSEGAKQEERVTRCWRRHIAATRGLERCPGLDVVYAQSIMARKWVS